MHTLTHALTSAAAIMALLPATGGAQQLRVPTDIELHSAYCVSVIRGGMELQQKMIAQQDAWAAKHAATPEQQQLASKIRAELQEAVTKFQTVLDRLQLYLLPRMGVLDPMALNAAMNRGEADVKAVMATAEQCGTKCNRSSTSETEACNASCDKDKDLIDRVKACSSPTWLPF